MCDATALRWRHFCKGIPSECIPNSHATFGRHSKRFAASRRTPLWRSFFSSPSRSSYQARLLDAAGSQPDGTAPLERLMPSFPHQSCSPVETERTRESAHRREFFHRLLRIVLKPQTVVSIDKERHRFTPCCRKMCHCWTGYCSHP